MHLVGKNPQLLTQFCGFAEVVRWSPLVSLLAEQFPLPTLVPTATPIPPTATAVAPPVSGAGCPYASDATYGYSTSNPIQVGGGPFGGGPARERAFLDALRGPQAQALAYERTGSVPVGDVILDAYRVTYDGLATPILLYFDIYNDTPRLVPVGLSCGSALP
jgi:hypothetical protein